MFDVIQILKLTLNINAAAVVVINFYIYSIQ